MIIYTDGSFNKKLSKTTTAYAAVIVTEETETEYIADIVYGVILEPDYVNMWNVGGEIWAVLAGLDYAINRYHPNNIQIYHDYIGLSRWVTGEWKAKNSATASYARHVKSLKRDRRISFIKVTGHSNNLLNDIADEYANKGTSNYLESGKLSTLVTNIHIPRRY